MASKKRINKLKKAKLSDKQIMKRKVRASSDWADLRTLVRDEQKTDPVSMRPLSRSFNLHHISQDDNYYNDLSRERFVGLNDYSHRCVHYLYDIIVREGDYKVLDRIRDIVDRMIELTEEDKNR